METATIGVLISLLKAAGGSAVKGLLGNPFMRPQVAWSVYRRAKKASIGVTFISLLRWLSREDVRRQLAAADPLSVETAVRNLAWRMSGGSEDQAPLLVSWVLEAYLLSVSPQAATAIASSRTQQEVARGTMALQTAVARLPEQLHDQRAQFERDLSLLHPWMTDKALELALRWPPMRDLAHSAASTPDRQRLLSDWGTHPPKQLSAAPAEAWLWFGEVASEYGARRAAVELMSEGIARGAADADYWWARAALVLGPEPDESEMRLLLARATGHPVGVALLSIMDGEPGQGEEALSAWSPTRPEDLALRAYLRSAAAAGNGQVNLEIGLLEDAAQADANASAVCLAAAQKLLARARYGVTISVLSDCDRARHYAILSRDSRRLWSGDSVEAILVALKATALAGDLEAAKRLVTAAPAGDATTFEATDPRLVSERATLAALTGDEREALTLLDQVDNDFDRSMILGHLAEGRGDNAEAINHWTAAWADASCDPDRIQAAGVLAPLGDQMPDLSELAVAYPEVVRRIKTIHEVMSTQGDRLPVLRARAHESEQLTVALADLLLERDDALASADVLRAGAIQWQHPLLMKMAASRQAAAGDFEGATESCADALHIAGSNWPGELDTLGILFNAQESLALQDKALLTAKRMVTLAPENLDARWILIQCLLREGELAAAWAALDYRGQPLAPRSPQEVRAWIDLLARFDSSPLFLTRALKVYDEWAADEELQGIILAQVHTKSAKHELSADEISALQELTATYLADHPENSVFRSFPVGPDDDPLKEIEEELKRHAPTASLIELNQRIREGELPVGLGAAATGRSYTECAILGISGLVFSHAPALAASGAEAVAKSLGSSVVLDPTAAATLARLDAFTATRLIGAFSSLDTTVPVYRDALRAQESLAMRSTMSIHWNEVAQKTVVTQISDETAERYASQANTIASLFSRARRINWPRLRHLTEMGGASEWLGSLDYSIDSGQGFWCDDYLLRTVAIEKGVSTFGTVDLLRASVIGNQLSNDAKQVAEALLIDSFHVDLGFDSEVMRLSAELAGWQTRGAAANVARPASWADPEQTLSFLLTAVDRNRAVDPAAVQAWVHQGALGIIRLAGADSEGAQRNVVYLLARLIAHTSADRSLVPFLITGVRAALGAYPDLADPLEDVLRSLHASLVKQHGHPTAATLLLDIVGSAPASDRDCAARIILTAPI